MNYLKGQLSYNDIPLNKMVSLYSDGTIINNGDTLGQTSIKDTLFGLYQQNEKGAPLMVYLPKSNFEGYLFMNVNLDYIYYTFASYQVNVTLVTFGENQTINDTLSQSSDYVSQYTMGEYGYMSDYAFGTLQYDIYYTSYGNEQRESVFDLSMTRNYFADISSENLEGKVFNILGSKPDNSLFYNYALKISGSNLSSNTLDIISASDTRGQAIFNSWRTAYDTGYSNGYYNGLVDGYNSNIDTNTATAFDYIGGAFGAVNNILAIEVLPHVTLGLCFSIPLVFVLIMTIFKLVKK